MNSIKSTQKLISTSAYVGDKKDLSISKQKKDESGSKKGANIFSSYKSIANELKKGGSTKYIN
jgi:hypothetical protein